MGTTRRMTMRPTLSVAPALLAILTSTWIAPQPVNARQDPGPAQRFTLQYERPHFSTEEGESFGVLSGAAVLGYERPLGRIGILEVELPVAWGSSAYQAGSARFTESGQALGNPLIALRWTPPESPQWEVGARVRIPLARSFGDDRIGRFMGLRTDLTRPERFMSDLTTLELQARHTASSSPSVEAVTTASLGTWIWTGGPGSSEVEPFGTYELGVRAADGTRTFRPGATLRGHVFLGSDAGSGSDRFTHLARAEVGFPAGPADALVWAGVPLRESWRDSVPFLLGLAFEWVPIR